MATEQPRALHRETRDDSAAQWKAEEAVDVPDIDAELPSSWKVIEEEFVFVYMVRTYLRFTGKATVDAFAGLKVPH